MKKYGRMISLCLAVVLMAGCNDGGFQIEETRGQEICLRFAGYKVGEDKIAQIEKILNSYMENHEDTVIVYEGIQDDYVDVMTNRVKNGTADDLFMISDQALTTYAEKGWYGTKIKDLSDKELINLYSPVVRKLFTVDGKIGAVPMSMSVTGMMANMDVLNACGIDEMPKTYEEWVEDMRTVREHGYTPMVNYQGNASSLNFLLAARAAAPAVEQGVLLEEQKVEEIFEGGIRDLYELMDEGLIDREQAARETEARSYQTVLGEQFAAGGIAFAVVPSWCITSFLKGKPEFNYQFGGLPMGDGGPMVCVRASSLVAISNEGENIEKAEEFLDYMMKPEHIEGYAAGQNALSPLAGAKNENELYADIQKLIEAGRIVSDTDSRIPFNMVKRLNYVSKQMLEKEPVEQILLDLALGTADE